MKRSLLIYAAALMMLVNVPHADADQIQLTLDLRNAARTNAESGGTWELFARKVENGSAPDGDFGIAGIRAVLNNISAENITFATNVGQLSGGPYVNTLSNGAVELVYGQDLNGTVVNNVGIFANERRDVLIASGSWPAGPRPTFGADADGDPSEGNFLGGGSAPYPNSLEVAGADILTSVVTLGDLNTTGVNAGIINNLDAVALVAQLPGAPNPAPYNPAGDINQVMANNGVINNLDAVAFLQILGGPSVAAVGAVPEPTTVGLAAFAALGLIARRRRV